METIRLSPSLKGRLYKEAAPLALETRKNLDLGLGPIDNMYELLESKGFLILSFPSIDDKLSGFHTKKGNIDCIFINSNHVLGRQYFSIAHELFHAKYNNGSMTVCYSDEDSIDGYTSQWDAENEYKANCFAAQFLMTEDEMIRAIDKYKINSLRPNVYDIIKLQHHFNVSFKAALKRLNKISKFDYSLYKNLARYSLIEYKEYLEKYTFELELDTYLIRPTTARLPRSFVENIANNLEVGKISNDKAAELEFLIREVTN